jgi:integrase
VKRLPIVVLAFSLGCRATAPDAARAPHETRLVAILPFFDQTGRSDFDGEEFGSILASEFIKASGVSALRPSQLRAAMAPGEKIATVADAVRVARKLGADTVLACSITDYDPYDPPRISVHTQLLGTEPRTLSTQDLDVLLQSASWHKGPLPLTRDGARHALAAFEEVYDARDSGTRRLLRAYAEKTAMRESELLAVQPRYLQFVSTQIILRVRETAFPHGS